MTRMTGPDCVVMCNLINTHTHTHTWEDQREWHRMTRMTRPDCAVMCNLINTHTHTHTHTHCSLFVGFPSLLVAPSGEKPALPMSWKGTSLSTISRVFVPICFFEQSVVVDVEGVGLRPRAVVAGRGVVAVCTRISSQEYVYGE